VGEPSLVGHLLLWTDFRAFTPGHLDRATSSSAATWYLPCAKRPCEPRRRGPRATSSCGSSRPPAATTTAPRVAGRDSDPPAAFMNTITSLLIAAGHGPARLRTEGSLAGRAVGNLRQANPDRGVFLGGTEPVTEFPRHGEKTFQDVRCRRPARTRVRGTDLLKPLP